MMPCHWGRVVTLCFMIAVVPRIGEARDYYQAAGDVLRIALPAAALGTAAMHRDTAGVRQFYLSFTTSFAATYLLKYAVVKERPKGGWESFPSGHASAAFCGASFLHARYGWAYGIPAYLLAAFTGWSRVESKSHYWEDVAVGAVIGTGFSFIFTRPFAQKHRIAITPMIGNGVYGAMVRVPYL